MRITNAQAASQYTKALNTNYYRLNQYYNQAMSGRRFNKFSEDSASGVRAMQIRRQLSRIDSYKDNISATKTLYKASEDSIRQINEVAHEVHERWVQASSDNCGDDERAIIATELESLRDHMLSLMNSKFSEGYLYGGTNTHTQPFTVDELGNLYYNGVNVRDIDSNHPLMNDIASIDIGFGLNFNDSNNLQQGLDQDSAFVTSFNGLDYLGTGSENLYLVLTDMIDQLNSGNFNKDEMGANLERFLASSKNVNIGVTQLGADYNRLDYQLDRLESERLLLIERQDAVEGIDMEEALMNLKVQEYIYNAALSIGQRLLQPTLFNFIS